MTSLVGQADRPVSLSSLRLSLRSLRLCVEGALFPITRPLIISGQELTQ
jgi:hypothetical protein